MNAPRTSTPTALPTTMHALAVAGVLCSAIGFVRVNLLWVAALELLCGLGLIVGRWLHHTRLLGAAHLTLIAQALILGAAWPSAITIVALAVAPAGVVTVRQLLTNTSARRTLVYIAGSAALAAWSLAAEAWLLATLQAARPDPAQ